MGPALVILTRGADRATGYLAEGPEVTVPVERVQIVDTVGAGDAFNAGVIAKLSELGALQKMRLRELDPEVTRKALAFGAKIAAVTVSRAGANPPWAEELSRRFSAKLGRPNKLEALEWTFKHPA